MNLHDQKVLVYSVDENMTPNKLRKLENTSEFFADEKYLQKAEQLQNRIQEHNIISLLEDDLLFPPKFSTTKNPPAIIYAMWNLELLDSPILWIVWPRDMSQYADQVMHALFHQMNACNIVTVSWMARGVDHLCHQLSIASHKPTIAILWWWLRHYRNSSARNFMQQIVDNWGLVLSEFKLDFKPTNWSFPQRNRLIAWLSDMVFLPEAREWSGSLITADFAYQMHKPIFVAPNPLFSENGIWSNNLISSWKAKLLSDFGQILKFFMVDWFGENDENRPIYEVKRNQFELNESEKKIVDIVSHHNNQDFSLWINEVSADFWEAMSQITELEMKWVILQSSPGCYFVTN